MVFCHSSIRECHNGVCKICKCAHLPRCFDLVEPKVTAKRPVVLSRGIGNGWIILLETNIAPEDQWLEDHFLFALHDFPGASC